MRIFWRKGVMPMEKALIYPIGGTPSLEYAADDLRSAGIALVDHPTPDATHLLLDVPSFAADGMLRCGGDVEKYLQMLPPEIVIIGGNLNHPALRGYQKIDLLQDAQYLAMNAAITAGCALRVAAPLLRATFTDVPVLVIGWGRIGKCLGQLLKNIGADVTIAARRESDRAMLKALGYRAAEISAPLDRYRLIFNTAPEPVADAEKLAACKNCVKIDLASKRGLAGDDVIWARGLPGIHAPESSGKQISETILRIFREVS